MADRQPMPISRADFFRAVFDAVFPVVLAEARSESRHLNPWFSSKARGLPPPPKEGADG